MPIAIKCIANSYLSIQFCLVIFFWHSHAFTFQFFVAHYRPAFVDYLFSTRRYFHSRHETLPSQSAAGFVFPTLWSVAFAVQLSLAKISRFVAVGLGARNWVPWLHTQSSCLRALRVIARCVVAFAAKIFITVAHLILTCWPGVVRVATSPTNFLTILGWITGLPCIALAVQFLVACKTSGHIPSRDNLPGQDTPPTLG